MLRLDLVQPADARTKNDPATEGVFLGEVEARVLDRVDGRHERELREAVDALGIAQRNVAFGRPIAHFAAKLHLEVRGVEGRDRPDAALAAVDSLPKVFDLTAERGDDAEAGYDDSSLHGSRYVQETALLRSRLPRSPPGSSRCTRSPGRRSGSSRRRRR